MKIGYARSTLGKSTDEQVEALKAAGCERIFQDVATAGSKVQRPELTRAIEAAKSGDTLVVCELVKLSKSVRGLFAMIKDLSDRGVSFVSLKEMIDTSTPAGGMFPMLAASLAQMDRDLANERTTISLKIAKDTGRTGGRPPVLSKEKLEAAKKMVEQGISVRAAAKAVGTSQATLYRHLEPKKAK